MHSGWVCGIYLLLLVPPLRLHLDVLRPSDEELSVSSHPLLMCRLPVGYVTAYAGLVTGGLVWVAISTFSCLSAVLDKLNAPGVVAEGR